MNFNPVLPVYAADPDIALLGERYFIYATNAGIYPSGPEFEDGQPGEHGHGFAVWSSDDLQTWRSDGPVLKFSTVSWARDLPNAWAPCIASRNGYFYFYFCADSRIGVAKSESPCGPFFDERGTPLVEYRDDLSAIDPMVFTDDDGQSLCYWGAVPGFWLEGKIDYVRMHLSVGKLRADMTTFDGPEMPTIFTQRAFESWHDLDHIEASHLTKRNGVYYLMWSAGNFGSDDEARTYRVEYARAVTPLGPWHRAPQPMLQTRRDLQIVGPGHHSVLQLPGSDEYWCCYHAHKGDADRRVFIDRLTFADDGQIAPVVPTLQGPPSRPVRFALKLRGFGPFASGANIGFELQTPRGDELRRVEFFAGTQPLGVVENARDWTWRDARSGFARVWARAVTADGDVLTSAPLDLDVL